MARAARARIATSSGLYQELVCTAGITEAGEWVRLYPVDYRYRPKHQKFRKYQWIEVDLAPQGSGSDNRKESRKPDLDSIKLLGAALDTDDSWRKRREIIDRLSSVSWVSPLSGCGIRLDRHPRWNSDTRDAHVTFAACGTGCWEPFHDLLTVTDSRPAAGQDCCVRRIRRAISKGARSEGLRLRPDFLMVRLAGAHVEATVWLLEHS